MSLQNHRVVVQLTDVEGEEQEHEYSSLTDFPSRRKVAPASPVRINAEVEVVNEKTLLLSLQNTLNKVRNYQSLNFDCVGNKSDPHTRAEISAIVDELLSRWNNCCLLKFSNTKQNHLHFICNLLVSEVDKRLQQMHGSINTIKLEYFDIQKYDVVNLLNEDTKRKRRSRVRNQFSNTLELHKWFQTEYAHLWASGVGHDCLDLQFIIQDVAHRLHKVKFSFFSMYMNKMDNDTKAQVRNFFENLNTEKRFKHSLLTDCLKEYFRGHDTWHTWIVFDIPVTRNMGGAVIDDMIKLANAAYVGVHEDIKPIDINNIDSDVKLSEMSEGLSAQHRRQLPSSSHMRRPSLVRKGEIFRSSINLTGKDFNSLSFWYSKMDEKYLNAIVAMEAYYDRKYKTKISKICGDIKQMVRTIDQSIFKESDLQQTPSQNSDIELQMSYNSYKNALLEFRKMAKDIEVSQYGQVLRIYLKTKSYELSQHALHIKVKQLEMCQERLSGTITDEVTVLNTLKHGYNLRVHPKT